MSRKPSLEAEERKWGNKEAEERLELMAVPQSDKTCKVSKASMPC